jgi:hypothetical protein
MRNATLRAQGLVLNLPIDEGIGLLVRDRSGLKNDGTVSATGASWVTGNFPPFYNALIFDGLSGNVLVPYNSSLAPTTEVTVECWIKFAALSSWRNIVQKGNSGASEDYALALDNTSPQLLYFIIHTSGGSDVWSPKSLVSPTVGVWYHVVGTYKSGVGAQLYVNGVAQGAATPGSGTIRDGGTSLGIGSTPDLGGFTNCTIQNVMVYNRCLADWEIMDDYLSGPFSYTTLDSKRLTVILHDEKCAASHTQWDAWVNSLYKRKVKVLGIVRQYILTAIEQNSIWSSSLAKYFEDACLAGSQILLASDQAVRPVQNVNVYVLDVSWTLANLGGQNIRKFLLTLQEA